MKRNLLFTALLLVMVFFVNENLNAQSKCQYITQDMIASVTYDVKVGGDFVFERNFSSNIQIYGFQDVSPIVSNITFGTGYLKFTISSEFIERIGKNNDCFDVVVLVKSGGTKTIRIYFAK